MLKLAVFIGALAAAYSVPGPDMVFVLQTATTSGARRAMAATLGLASARASHVFFATIGLAALFRTVPGWFEVARLVGALYLTWLGIVILNARTMQPQSALGKAGKETSNGKAFLCGYLTDLLNPKALLFCSVLLPQFVNPAGESIVWQFVYLGAILVIIGLVFDMTFAISGARLRGWLSERPVIRAIQRYAIAALLTGCGADLIFTQLPQ